MVSVEDPVEVRESVVVSVRVIVVWKITVEVVVLVSLGFSEMLVDVVGMEVVVDVMMLVEV